MEKLISLRYQGKCRKCGNPISAGGQAMWHGKHRGISHYPDCQPKPKPDAPKDKPKRPEPEKKAAIIEWGELRELYTALMSGTKAVSEIVSRPRNRNTLQHLYDNFWKPGSSDNKWSGATAEDMKTWIVSGFHVPGIENASPDLVPLRKRRKLKFDEDGEVQLDLALSGFDYPFIEWEKRERKPGMKLEIGITFSSSTNERVVADYQRWIAQAISTLEESGYDLEVNLVSPTRGLWTDVPSTYQNSIVRVKRENEAADFAQWSALLSPGGYRHLVFLAKVVTADRNGHDTDTQLGMPTGIEWTLDFDEETRTLRVMNPTTDSAFPAALMTERFLRIIHK